MRVSYILMSLTNLLLVVLILIVGGVGFMLFKVLMSKKPDTPGSPFQPNKWAAMRDFLIAALYTGQLPLAIIGLILVIVACKLSSSDDFQLLMKVIAMFEKVSTFGWILFFITLFGSWFVVKRLKSLQSKEIKRVQERTKFLEEKNSFLEAENKDLKMKNLERPKKQSK
jgi:hypothetical protein